METDRDPYEVLGVPRGASDGEIKEAYREKAKKFHPDASDREDAAEVFKRVKEAYEEIYTEGESFSSSSDSSADVRGEGGTGRETEAETGKKEEGRSGFGTGRRRETGSGPGPGAGFGRDRDRDRDDGTGGRTRNATRSGFGDEKGEDEKETNEEEDGDPDEFEVHKQLGLGWKLGETDAGSWFVFTEGETAPYVDGVRMLYLDDDGGMSDDAVYFGTRSAAERTYEEHYGEEDGFENEHQDEWEDSHRGFAPGGKSYTRKTEQRKDGFEDEGWGERVEDADLDELWRLYYQERESSTEDETRTQRRWGVTTDVAGDDRFVNPSGEYQEVEFWFEERGEAVGAYESYVRNTRAAREGFGGSGTAATETASAAGRGEEGEGFTVRTASMGYFLYEDLYEATEPIRENSLAAVALATAFFAVLAYLFEPFRGLLFFFFLPVYVGVITIAQTPYLLFFVFAYTVVVAAVLIVHVSMNH